MAHSFTNLLYHVVFATKERNPWLDSPWRAEVHGRLGTIVREEGGMILAVNGMEEHVHILAKLRADQALSAFMAAVKARSSGWIHRTRPELAHFGWQTGYGAFTVSQSQVERVRNYIADQERHHEKTPFREELRRLLRAHGADVDEELLWD